MAMKHALLLFLFCLPILESKGQKPQPLFFEGQIVDATFGKINIQLLIDEAERMGSINLPGSGINKLQVKVVVHSTDSLVFVSPYLKAHYKGAYAGDSITGVWTQLGENYPLRFHSIPIPVRARPQNPIKPYPYQEEEIVYHNRDKSIQFGATITYPKEQGPHPAVILISGSGQQDRDETLFEHKPFKVIADYLTRRGIVVLRVDDRGVGQTTGETTKATSETYSKDVLAGVAYLKSRPEVNPKQIGLIGHSEGGMIAPLAARNNPDIAFIVSLAGIGVDGIKLAVAQWEYSIKDPAYNITPHTFEQLKVLQESILKIAAEPTDNITAKQKISKTMDQWRTDQDSITSVLGGYKYKYDYAWVLDLSFTKQILTPWTRYITAYNPENTLKSVHCPMLILNGEKDCQVYCDLNMNGFKEIARKQQKKKMEFRKFKDLNHLFQHCQTGKMGEYIEIEETFAPEVLECMANWIDLLTLQK